MIRSFPRVTRGRMRLMRGGAIGAKPILTQFLEKTGRASEKLEARSVKTSASGDDPEASAFCMCPHVTHSKRPIKRLGP